jgi:Family of unknown function (DUF6348)
VAPKSKPKRATLVRCCLIAIVTLSLVACESEKPVPKVVRATDPRPASLTDVPPNDFTPSLQGLFEKAGASDIEVRGAAVSRKGNQTTFAARPFYGPSGSEELEFLTTLPDGRVIQDFVSGEGDDPQAAREDGMRNFALTTFPVLYAGFFEQHDELQLVRNVTINGTPRQMFVGDFLVRGDILNNDDVNLIRESVVDAIKSTLPSDDLLHWYKIVYGTADAKLIVKETSMDSFAETEFSRAMDSFTWPKSNGAEFYSVKFFVLVK